MQTIHQKMTRRSPARHGEFTVEPYAPTDGFGSRRALPERIFRSFRSVTSHYEAVQTKHMTEWNLVFISSKLIELVRRAAPEGGASELMRTSAKSSTTTMTRSRFDRFSFVSTPTHYWAASPLLQSAAPVAL
jgi:hypothetical protein